MCNEARLSARALPSTHNELEIPSVQQEDQRFFDQRFFESFDRQKHWLSFVMNRHGEAEEINKGARGEIKISI